MPRRKKVTNADGVVNIKATQMQEAMADVAKVPTSLNDKIRKNTQNLLPKKPPTITGKVKEQLYSVEDAADRLGLSLARVRGLIRTKKLKTERIMIKVDEGERPKTALRIRASELKRLEQERDERGDQIDANKKKRLNRKKRTEQPKQYILSLDEAELARLQQMGFAPRARFGAQAIGGIAAEYHNSVATA
jgi:hypothetical protein